MRVGAAGEYIFFAETITRGRIDQGGRCVDGMFTVAPAAGSLAVAFFANYQGKALAAWGMLQQRDRTK